MVYLKYVSADGDEVIYNYMPEKKDTPKGRISLNSKIRECAWLSPPCEGELSWYREHAWRRIEEMLDKGELKQSPYEAWY